MNWSVLLDCFFTLNKDISFSLEDHECESITEDIDELKSLLKDDDKSKIDKFTCGITNHLEIVALKYFEKAIHFGIYCGMETQKAIDNYFEEE